MDTLSLLTRKTSNTLESLLELEAPMFIDYSKKIETQLIDEHNARKKQAEKQANEQKAARARANSYRHR